MSYSFTVKKVGDELVLVNAEYAARHLPDGAVITVNGHDPVEGTSPYGTIGVSLAVPFLGGYDGQMQQLVSASAGYNSDPNPTPPPTAEPVTSGVITHLPEG